MKVSWNKVGLGLAGVALTFGCATAPRALSSNGSAPIPPDAATASAAVSRVPATAKGVPFSSPDLGFELDKPAGSDWAVATNVTSPEGRAIPVVVAHPDSGAQIVIQVSEPVDSPRLLAGMLREKLNAEQTLALGQPRKLEMNCGSEAYGFEFAIKGEAKGRVAVISTGDQIVLVVASWPEKVDKHVVADIDGVVRSVRTSGATARATIRPDKA
jgi:hypothetical protein